MAAAASRRTLSPDPKPFSRTGSDLAHAPQGITASSTRYRAAGNRSSADVSSLASTPGTSGRRREWCACVAVSGYRMKHGAPRAAVTAMPHRASDASRQTNSDRPVRCWPSRRAYIVRRAAINRGRTLVLRRKARHGRLSSAAITAPRTPMSLFFVVPMFPPNGPVHPRRAI